MASYQVFEHFIALDPGETTGVAIYTIGKREGTINRFWKRMQITDLKDLWRVLAVEEPKVVAYEMFTQSLGAGSTNFGAVEAIGVIKLYGALTDKELVPQARQVKNFWTDEKIKQCGLWEPGMKHAMDATRHMLYYLMQEARETYYINRLKRPSSAG